MAYNSDPGAVKLDSWTEIRLNSCFRELARQEETKISVAN
jgi:hypothetical protein